jgi:glycosyltransferase involved in cell wall biosynthesis
MSNAFEQEFWLLGKVAIDASSAGSGGAIRYLSKICPSLGEASPETTFYLIARSSQRSRLPSLPPNFRRIGMPESTRFRPYRLWWLQFILPKILRQLDIDVLLGSSDVTSTRSFCPLLLVIHNYNPFSPMTKRIWDRKTRVRLALQRKVVRGSARRADQVVFVSEWSRQAMSPSLGISLEKSTVIYHGVDDSFGTPLEREAASQTENPFILVVSVVLEHKNLVRLVEAYDQLLQSLDQKLDLVIAGPIGSVKLYQTLQLFLEQRGLTNNVRFLDSITSDELLVLYHQAELMVFPSLEETFGLPLIEAMAVGLPVVVSRASAIPEVCGDAARYFDPQDVADMTRAISAVLTDYSLREDLVQRGLTRASTFSWSTAAESLLTLMRRLAEGNPESRDKLMD